MKAFILAALALAAMPSVSAFALYRRQASCSDISQYFKLVTTALFSVNYLRNFAHPCDQDLIPYFEAQGLDGAYAVNLICLYDQGFSLFNESLEIVNDKIVVAWIGLFAATTSNTGPARQLSCDNVDTSLLQRLDLEADTIKSIICDYSPCTNGTTSSSSSVISSTVAPSTTCSSSASSGVSSTMTSSSATASSSSSLGPSSATSSGSVATSSSVDSSRSVTSSSSTSVSSGSSGASSSTSSSASSSGSATGSVSSSVTSSSGSITSASQSNSSGTVSGVSSSVTASVSSSTTGPPVLPSSSFYYG